MLFPRELEIQYVNELCPADARVNNSFMNKVAVNLRQLMRARGISENQLSRDANVAQPTIHRIVAGHTEDPRDRTLRPIAEWFGVTVEQLRTELPTSVAIDPKRDDYRIKPTTGSALRERSPDVAVDEVTVKLGGGTGKPKIKLVATGDRRTYAASWFSAHNVAPADIRMFQVHGAGMERTLFDGDRVTVNLRDTRIADGHVHVLVTGGPQPDVKVRRLFKRADGRVRVVSDHPDKTLYPDEVLGARELARVVVLGRVIERSGVGGL